MTRRTRVTAPDPQTQTHTDTPTRTPSLASDSDFSSLVNRPPAQQQPQQLHIDFNTLLPTLTKQQLHAFRLEFRQLTPLLKQRQSQVIQRFDALFVKVQSYYNAAQRVVVNTTQQNVTDKQHDGNKEELQSMFPSLHPPIKSVIPSTLEVSFSSLYDEMTEMKSVLHFVTQQKSRSVCLNCHPLCECETMRQLHEQQKLLQQRKVEASRQRIQSAMKLQEEVELAKRKLRSSLKQQRVSRDENARRVKRAKNTPYLRKNTTGNTSRYTEHTDSDSEADDFDDTVSAAVAAAATSNRNRRRIRGSTSDTESTEGDQYSVKRVDSNTSDDIYETAPIRRPTPLQQPKQA